MAAKERKSAHQVRFLLSDGSPLSNDEKERLRSEIASGEVQVRGGRQALAMMREGMRRRRRRA